MQLSNINRYKNDTDNTMVAVYHGCSVHQKLFVFSVRGEKSLAAD